MFKTSTLCNNVVFFIISMSRKSHSAFSANQICLVSSVKWSKHFIFLFVWYVDFELSFDFRFVFFTLYKQKDNFTTECNLRWGCIEVHKASWCHQLAKACHAMAGMKCRIKKELWKGSVSGMTVCMCTQCQAATCKLYARMWHFCAAASTHVMSILSRSPALQWCIPPRHPLPPWWKIEIPQHQKSILMGVVARANRFNDWSIKQSLC